jgi:hypothetical protein
MTEVEVAICVGLQKSKSIAAGDRPPASATEVRNRHAQHLGRPLPAVAPRSGKRHVPRGREKMGSYQEKITAAYPSWSFLISPKWRPTTLLNFRFDDER